jgi:hypothetical protein
MRAAKETLTTPDPRRFEWPWYPRRSTDRLNFNEFISVSLGGCQTFTNSDRLLTKDWIARLRGR